MRTAMAVEGWLPQDATAFIPPSTPVAPTAQTPPRRNHQTTRRRGPGNGAPPASMRGRRPTRFRCDRPHTAAPGWGRRGNEDRNTLLALGAAIGAGL